VEVDAVEVEAVEVRLIEIMQDRIPTNKRPRDFKYLFSGLCIQVSGYSVFLPILKVKLIRVALQTDITCRPLKTFLSLSYRAQLKRSFIISELNKEFPAMGLVKQLLILVLKRRMFIYLFTGAQPKAGTGHKMQSVPVVFSGYIVRDLSLSEYLERQIYERLLKSEPSIIVHREAYRE